MEGLDCWGFLKLVYADLGFKLFDIEDLEYEKNWGLHGRDYLKEHYQNDWQNVETPMVLDGVLFMNSKGIANHAGIVLDEDKFIHCCRAGVVIGRYKNVEWSKRIEGFYRLKGRTW